jgi:CRP/FNR family cyclic AMP-dependent transcriptional regulator
MTDLDFSRAAKRSLYDPGLASEFFALASKPETVAQGTILFAENEKSNRLLLQRDKMYLLVEGEIGLIARNRLIGTVRKGEIFGEMASISQMPRSATAVANLPCRVIAMDDRQFQSALRKMPEFALMLMSVMIGRIRDTIGRLRPDSVPDKTPARESAVFDKAALGVLARALSQTRTRYERNTPVVKEGDAGVLMYVVLEGRLSVSVKGKTVEKIGTGGVFGEMALVERTPRLATVTAETPCVLLAIGRNTFLDLVKGSPEFAVSLLGAIGERARFVASHRA